MKCLPIEELLALPDVAASDPHWEHVRACPRCRSLLASFRDFERSPGGAAARPGEDAAVARLASALEAEILGGGRPAQAPSQSVAPLRGATVDRSRWSWRRLFSTLIPAVGAAAVVAGAFLLLREEAPIRRHPEPVMRGDGSGQGSTLVGHSPRLLPGGGIEFCWARFPAADGYVLLFLDAGFRETARLAGGDTSSAVSSARLLKLAQGGAVYWQAEALEQGDVVAKSAPAPLPASR
jgi:hypothetical protein